MQLRGTAGETVHRHLGAGLLESTYEHCLMEELKYLGLGVERQVAVPLVYRSLRLEAGYRIDLLVEKEVVVELKAVEKLHPVYTAQLLSYLRLAGLRAGLLFNFNVEVLVRGGLKRILYDGPRMGVVPASEGEITPEQL
jgi:GxxExxY protein